MNKNNKAHFYPTRIDLPLELQSLIVETLNKTLATTIDLKTQVKHAHWNVKGMDFYQLHLLFDEIATELEEFTDLIGERITAIGGCAKGTAHIATMNSILPEYPFEIIDGKDHIIALTERLACYAKLLREGIQKTEDLGDINTNDLYIEVSRAIDKRLWFLEAHLQTKEACS